MNGSPQVQSFTYDAMDRLLSAEANDGTVGDYSETYSYSATTGNLASKGGLSYTDGDSNHAHAVTGLSSGNAYTYDPNGNMTQRVVNSSTYTLTYDVENRLVGAGGAASAEFGYDGDGARVIVSEGVTTTIHIGNYFQWNVNSEEMTRYYFAGTTRVAMRKGSAAPLWLLGDHLGSTSVAAQNDGSVHIRQGYRAWGESRFEIGAPATEYQFTGQFNQTALGIYFYQSRFYDPALGRWLQPDTIVPDQYNILDWDRYQFVRSNPVIYSDPGGHFPILPGDFVLHFLGLIPDDRGISIAKKHVTQGGDNIIIAAAIAVQAQWYSPIIDNPIVHSITKSSGVGIAQISPGSFGYSGSDLMDPENAVDAMGKRIQKVIDQCKGCSGSDKLIAAALAQNGPGFSAGEMAYVNNKFSSDGGIRWNDYFSTRDKSRGINGMRADFFNGQYDTRFMLWLFLLNLRALNEDGWELPYGLIEEDLDEIEENLFPEFNHTSTNDE